ncbi:Uu.00g139200.m01.CDS01 [Anthostomella pinea]|uniref:Uu.00g139200.m01.CDS01 n=1 Tax=Anthostomella pinea TaxID=933095 RepID=A0AAI8VQM3_9PEZI|nr:Uu.00g139200.m01.CDS01 [Anthostomella pinea]
MAIWKRKIAISDNTVTTAWQLTTRRSLVPNLLVTILFFLWGFAYGLLDVLNSHFQQSLNLTHAQSAALSTAYFGAYLFCPPTISGWILRRSGFRVTFMTGLAVLAVGCLLFWPSGLEKSFAGFCGSMFVVGAGLSTLETAADPFLAICGPPKYSEIRLNLAQAIQGVGSFVAPLLAGRVFFANTLNTNEGLKNVQWVYLGVACFVGLLILLFFFAPMPEITDADMGVQEREIGEYDPGPLRKQYNLFLAVWSQFCYVGAQVAVANYFINFVQETGLSKAIASDLLAVGQGLYALNRFVAGFLMMKPRFKPRYILGVYLGLCFVFIVPAITTSGTCSIAMLMLVLSFESVSKPFSRNLTSEHVAADTSLQACFATIFTLGLRGLGRHTKIGGSLLVAAISGGMVFPAATGAVVDRRNAHAAMAVPMAGYILAWIYPVYVNVWNRETMDVRRTTNVGIYRDDKGDLRLTQHPSHVTAKPSTSDTTA